MAKRRRRLELTLPDDHVLFQVPRGTRSQMAIYLMDIGLKFEEITQELISVNNKLSKLEEKTLDVKIQDAVNPDIKNLKESLEISRREELEVGDVIEGIAMWVTRRDIEIEVDNCITMHIPAKEYAYSRVLDLRKEVRPGDKIKAEFVGIDEEGNLIASRKNVMPDPWKDIHERYQPRNIYLARVKGFLRNRHTSENEGVFVSLEKDIDALASPMPFFRVELDDYVAFEVSAVDSESCKIKGRLTGLAPVN